MDLDISGPLWTIVDQSGPYGSREMPEINARTLMCNLGPEDAITITNDADG